MNTVPHQIVLLLANYQNLVHIVQQNAPEFLVISIKIPLLLFLSTITVVRVGSFVNVLRSVGHVKL